MYWGKHRSVYIAQQLGEYFQAKGKTVKIQHKSLERNKKYKKCGHKNIIFIDCTFLHAHRLYNLTRITA